MSVGKDGAKGAAKKRGLGRGLEALLGPKAAAEAPPLQAMPGDVLRTLPIDAMVPGKFQPRRTMDDAKLEEAKKNGATYTINSLKEDVPAKAHELTDGYGPTVTIDAACVKGSLLTALQATGNAGRVITMGFSVAPTEVNQFVITSKELDVRGSRLQNRKFQDVIDLVNEGKVDLRGSISHTWNFEDAQAAFDFVDSRDPSYRKGVLTFKK